MVKKLTPEQCLEKRQNKKTSKNNSWPELFKAVYCDDMQEVKRLIDAGYDVNVQDALGRTPLMVTGNIEIIRLLLQAGAQVNIQDKSGDFALRLAPYDVAKLLLEYGANVNLKNESGYSALLSLSSLKKIQLLLEHGANIRDVNNAGENLLILLGYADHRHDEYQELLQNLSFIIDAGIDIDAQDTAEGNTALILACYEDNFVFAHKLLKLGADVTIKNHAGHTALEYAMMEGRLRQCQDHKECIERKIEQKKEREEVIRLIKNQLAK